MELERPDRWDAKYRSLKRATEETPNDGRAWAAFGDFLLSETENPRLAIRAFERAQELLPAVDMRLKLGRGYIQDQQFEKGIQLLVASASERPRPEAFCCLADAYLNEGKPEEAEKAAREAIQIDRAFEEGYYLLGESLKDRDKVSAIEAYRGAVALDKDYALAWQGLGSLLVRTDRIEEGVAALNKAVTLDPEDPWSRAYLANGLWRAGKLDEAEEQFLAAIELAPDFSDLRRWHEEFVAWRKEHRGSGNNPSRT